MAASNNNNAHKPELTLPSSIAQTMRLVQRVAHSATWGERIARHHQPPSAASFGPGLFRRFDAANAPGQWANDFAQRFVADELPPSSSALTLAPHAPAQRQVSAARQGALNWSGGDRFSSPASSFGGGSIDRSADTNASQSLISDLMGNGWGVQSARPDTLRRFAEPAGPEPAPASRSGAAQASPSPAPIHRSPAPAAPAQPQPSAPIRRSPESPSSPSAQPSPTINRQADAPAAAAAEASSTDSATPVESPAPAVADASPTDSATPVESPAPAAADASPVQRSADSTADAPSTASSTASASEDAAPIETAGTRPMTFFRGTPQSPLMRMGLSESAGSSNASAGSATINRQPVSGELPVVRPSRGSDEPSFSAPATGAINRQAQQTSTAPGTPITQVTSSNTIDRMTSSDAGSDSTTSPEIQRTASNSPTTAASESQAAASDAALPEVQRQAAAESSASIADSTINRSEAAAQTTAADTTSATTSDQTPVQRSAAPTSGSTSGSAGVAAASTSNASAPASDSAAQTASTAGDSVIARLTSDAATVQRTSAPGESNAAVSADSASAAADTSTADATTSAESPAPAAIAPAAIAPVQRTPVVQRKPVQSTRAASIDTVLPLASSLMRRYSAGSAQGTSGAMPLLRTFASTPAAVMRSPAPLTTITGSAQASGNTSTRASSATSPSLPPLVHRSPIVPLLPTATLQREPTASATASAASPAPRAATPALEWSALPLLQRLSGSHALPATPTASVSATDGISVAAQVINRMAIDQPGAASMPLLRMQAPSIARTANESAPTSAALMRSPATATADSNAGISADSPAGQSFMPTDSGAASLSEQPASASAGFGGQSVPAIHRSAILPSLSSAAFQPLTLLRMHVPDAPSTAQVDAPSSTAPMTSAIMMRAAEQPSISALASVSGDRTGSTPTSVSLPPLVHRSPIVPLLPTATLQREPTASATASAASPAPRAATPALEWSALPLLQRLSGSHALPATPAASEAAPASGTSVAAQVINRMAIDQPGAASMPLLRMHTPTEAPLLSREADPEVAASAEGSVPGSAPELPTTQPSVMSSLVRRSAILAPVPSFTSQAANAGSMAAPAAETSSGIAQRSPAADYALPMLQRTSVQRFFGSRPGLKLPSLGGIQNSVNSLAGQAQGMVGQVTGMPNQLMGQAQGMLDQVTGLPNQLMGQAQGMLDQVTGMPNQLMGQAQGMLDQVTGMPNQLMGQAQGMLDQVTGLPNQLMGQAQGMMNQVTGLPNQLMGQAQGMLDQVTGMPNQLMGQAQGMLDQVTGMPNQLMGQAQGMMNQVTGLPNQLMGQAQDMMNQVTGMPNQLMGQAQGMLDQVTGMPNQLMGQAQGMLDQFGGFPGQMQGTASNLLGGRSAELPLLRPVRSESPSAAQDPDAAPSDVTGGSSTQAASGGAGGAGGASGQATGEAGEAGKQGKPDIDKLAQQVYARLRHRLLIDRERLGR